MIERNMKDLGKKILVVGVSASGKSMFTRKLKESEKAEIIRFFQQY